MGAQDLGRRELERPPQVDILFMPEPMFRAFEEAFRGGGPYVRRQ